MAELEFRLFGRVGVTVDGVPSALAPLAAAVLARLLLARGALVPVDALFVDVWGDPRRRPARGDRVAVQKRIAELRGVLGSVVLLTDRGTPTAYRLVVDPGTVDAFRFEAAVAAGDAARARAMWSDTPLLGIGHLPFAADVVRRWTALFDGLGAAGGDDRRGTALRRGLPPVWRMPARITGFVPREPLMSDVADGLTRGPVVLCGIGGAGKTRLAVEYVYRHAAGYDLVWWVDAEEVDCIGDQLAALAVAMGACGPAAAVPEALEALQRHLRSRLAGSNLIVFDNADAPTRLAALLPAGTGHTLLTSRNPLWAEVASPVRVGVFERGQSRHLLCDRLPGLATADADRLAEQLGDLPLALAQAAGVMAEQGLNADIYLAELARDAAYVTGQGGPISYSTSLAAAVAVSVRRLDGTARHLLELCALLAPETIPTSVLVHAADVDRVAARRGLATLNRHGLARLDGGGVLIHRLTQAILRDTLDPGRRAGLRAAVEHGLGVAAPDDHGNVPATWPRWQALLPHLSALDPVTVDDPGLRRFAWIAVRYLLTRGLYAPALRYAAHLFQGWRARMGPDDLATLCAARGYAMALDHGGESAAAVELARDTLRRFVDTFGPYHVDTLQTENVLAMIIPDGAGEEAFDLARRSCRNRLRVLGAEHPEAVWSVAVLADRAAHAGRVALARRLAEWAWTALHRLLGEEHPFTHQSATVLADVMQRLGEHARAHDILVDALPASIRSLGADHAYVLQMQATLATGLLGVGAHAEAAALAQSIAVRYTELFGPDHPWTIEVLGDLAPALQDESVDELPAMPLRAPLSPDRPRSSPCSGD